MKTFKRLKKNIDRIQKDSSGAGVFISREEVESNIKRLESIWLTHALDDFGTAEETGLAQLWRELDIWNDLLNRCKVHKN